MHIFIACLYCISAAYCSITLLTTLLHTFIAFLLHIFIAHLCCIPLLYVYHCCMSLLCIFTAYIVIAYLHCIIHLLSICIAYVYCQSELHIFIAHLHCIYALRIFIAYLLHTVHHFPAQHNCITILVAYLYRVSLCISLLHIFNAHLYCTSAAYCSITAPHSVIAHLCCILITNLYCTSLLHIVIACIYRMTIYQ